MNKTTNIAHPLKNRTGSSQGNRSREALAPDYAPIDGKTLADRLYLVGEYAKLINHYEIQKDPGNNEYQQTGNWSDFFEHSLPFQLARLSKTSTEQLEKQFALLLKSLQDNPTPHTLEALLNFIYDKVILPGSSLYTTITDAGNSFSTALLAILKSSYQGAVVNFIRLYNASAVFLCISKKKFNLFLQPPWQLGISEIYELDPCIQQVKKGKEEAFLLAGEIASTLFDQLLAGHAEITEAVPGYIEESLFPLEVSLQQRHEPHLALMFTFLELFKHVQGDINSLGKKHLDFLYQEVLKLLPKDAVSDKAHLVFEIAKHLEEGYQLPEGLLLKDGKDAKKQEIQFGLDHEIILDKAGIKDLRTLSLFPVRDNSDRDYIEGVYIAPVANSLDGKGEKFKGDQLNWATLGDKYSKQISDGNPLPDENPPARLGFVLASPVLLLQEGTREIIITLNCNLLPEEPPLSIPKKDELIDLLADKLSVDGVDNLYLFSDFLLQQCEAGLDEADKLSLPAKEYISELLVKQDPYEIKQEDLSDFLDAKDPVSCADIFTANDKDQLTTCLNTLAFASKTVGQPLFRVSFSGEKKWIDAIPEVNIIKKPVVAAMPVADLQFSLKIILGPEEPAVVFFNEEALKEKLDLKEPFPLAKIVLNEALKIPCPADASENNRCCLKNEPKDLDLLTLSPYEFLQKLTLADAKIDVKVCGVKNLIVQNDENLQDINKPIMPFGPRPKVGEGWIIEKGANFYIGSKEIFCKNWQKFWVRTNWKDKPEDLKSHYEFYAQPDYEDGSKEIEDGSFRFLTSILEDGKWKEDEVNIFTDINNPATNNLLKLFKDHDAGSNTCTLEQPAATYFHAIERDDIADIEYIPKSMPFVELGPITVNTRKGFARMTLAGVSFQHERYAYVLARQMMALANLVDPDSLEEIVFQAGEAAKLCEEMLKANGRFDKIDNWSDTLQDLKDEIKKFPLLPPPFNNIPRNVPVNLSPFGLRKIDESVCERIDIINDKLHPDKEGLPKEPYTPLIKSLSIDYHAIANRDDMDIIHLYPYENTSKYENIEEGPTLFPYFNEEGTLFIGFENVTPGGLLSILFQLAEATADSERNRAIVNWHYLSNNNWRPLLPDFNIISDATDGLTISGIVTLAVPGDISKIGNTVMPDQLYWIKVSAPVNVKAVAETIGIHTQAARASARFLEGSDKGRLNTALPAGSIAKLVDSDFNVKKVEQLYDSYGGRQPEASGHFYIRVSEHLRHKGRGIVITDYEKIILEGFPEIYKVKCISHTMGLPASEYRRDLEVAPGYLIIAVIPDLTKLKSGNLFTPKAPISLLEKIGDHIRLRSSPFARIKVMNPRYEPIDVNIEVRLNRGKSAGFYAKKLKTEIAQFLAPWYLGDSEKLAFGQVVNFSDLVGFVEQRDYVDFITNLELTGKCGQTGPVIVPLTARSVLTGGEICVLINQEECAKNNAAGALKGIDVI